MWSESTFYCTRRLSFAHLDSTSDDSDDADQCDCCFYHITCFRCHRNTLTHTQHKRIFYIFVLMLLSNVCWNSWLCNFLPFWFEHSNRFHLFVFLFSWNDREIKKSVCILLLQQRGWWVVQRLNHTNIILMHAYNDFYCGRIYHLFISGEIRYGIAQQVK